jgi:hypothetical protein
MERRLKNRLHTVCFVHRSTEAPLIEVQDLYRMYTPGTAKCKFVWYFTLYGSGQNGEGARCPFLNSRVELNPGCYLIVVP